MNFFWLDASACVKRYIVEEGTPLIARNEGLFTFNPEIDNQAALDILIDPP